MKAGGSIGILIFLALFLRFLSGCSTSSDGRDDASPPDGQPTSEQMTEQLVQILGGPDEGWVPRVFAKLRDGQTPTEAAGIFPGADKLDSNGFAKVASFPKDSSRLLGVDLLRFYYSEYGHPGVRLLSEATVVFSSDVSASKGFYDNLVELAAAKYGPFEQADKDKRLIVWVDQDARSAAIMSMPNFADLRDRLEFTFGF